MGASCYGSHVGAMLYELRTTPRLGAPTGGYVGGIGGPLLGNMLQPLSKAHVLVGKDRAGSGCFPLRQFILNGITT